MEMSGSRDFLSKSTSNGNIFLSLKGVGPGKYLMDMFVRLSDGSLGIYSRGSITIQ